jgi:hypothetical protein
LAPLAIGLGMAGVVHVSYDNLVFTKVETGKAEITRALISMEQVLGKPEPGEDLFDQHPLGKILRGRKDIFLPQDAKYLMNHVRFQVGQEFSVRYDALSEGVQTTDLSAENTGTVITVPSEFGSFLKPQPSRLNLFLRLNRWRQSRALAAGLNPALDAYRAETLRLKAEADTETGILENEQGGKVENFSMDAVKEKGMPMQQFLKPVGGRNVGVPGAQLGLLLESFRRAVHPEGQSLWEAIKPQVDFLLKDGQVRSSALLVQALMITDTKTIGDWQLRTIIDGLKKDIEDAQKEQDPERLGAEIQFAAELINRSQLGNLPNPAELLKPVEKPVAGTPLDQVILMGQRVVGQVLVESLIADAVRAKLDAGNLQLLHTILRMMANPEQSAQLQQMLEKTALPEGSMLSTVVGEDVSKFVGSVITGRVEVKEVKYGTTTVSVAKPVVGNVFANSEQAILELAQSQQGVYLTWYQGQLPAALEEKGSFRSDVARHLAQNPLFSTHLTPGSAFAQAHAKWSAEKNVMNNQQIARVGIRMMKYYARQLEQKKMHQAGYDAALEALNNLFEHSGIFAKREIGQLGAIKVHAPASLSYGGILALAWLWSKHSGDFNLKDDLEKTLREQRLRNFRVESAA